MLDWSRLVQQEWALRNLSAQQSCDQHFLSNTFILSFDALISPPACFTCGWEHHVLSSSIWVTYVHTS